ncbi:unnamed protein product [Ambrosiozyma monospora]|uniref:Unnamed protein product n=1 Tax=Ambrosiozyma monospora TaxID=43982 RepID=A0A9W6Z3R0_AMBMO|nr:unnamed protein product [Ambrosiozyma monospora]
MPSVIILFSQLVSGDPYMYCSSRALFQLANRRIAPKIFTYTTKQGVPLGALTISFAFSLFALMHLEDTAEVSRNWMVSLVIGAQILNYFFMMIIYLHPFRACKVKVSVDLKCRLRPPSGPQNFNHISCHSCSCLAVNNCDVLGCSLKLSFQLLMLNLSCIAI